MGAVVDRKEGQQMLRTLLEILGDQHKSDNIAAAVRRHGVVEHLMEARSLD